MTLEKPFNRHSGTDRPHLPIGAHRSLLSLCAPSSPASSCSLSHIFDHVCSLSKGEPSAEPSSRGETIASCLKMRLPFGPSPQRYPVRLRGSRGSGQRGVGRTLTITPSTRHTPPRHDTEVSIQPYTHSTLHGHGDRLAHATPACGMEQTIIGTGKAYSRRD